MNKICGDQDLLKEGQSDCSLAQESFSPEPLTSIFSLPIFWELGPIVPSGGIFVDSFWICPSILVIVTVFEESNYE